MISVFIAKGQMYILMYLEDSERFNIYSEHLSTSILCICETRLSDPSLFADAKLVEISCVGAYLFVN